MVMVLLVATACATTHEPRLRSVTGSAPVGTVVPWVDEPAVMPTSTPTPPPSAPACAASDLSTASVAERHLGISQEDAVNVTVTNVGRRRCELLGTPGLVTRVGVHYETVPTRTGVWSSGSVVTPASVGVGERAFVQIAKTVACNGGTGTTTTAAGLALSIGHARIPIPGLTLSGTCSGVFVSPWFTLPPEPRSRFTALSASIETGTSVPRGRPLAYTVALTNTSDAPVVLDPCPVYGESIGKHLLVYRLNCAPGGIGAHGTVRFAMLLDIPTDLTPGDAVLGWQLLDPAGRQEEAIRHITVTG